MAAADAELWKAGADIARAADAKDVEALWGAADGTAKLIEGLLPNIDSLEAYPHTAELGAAYRASLPVMLEGATQIRDSITSGDAAGVVAGSKRLAEGVRLVRRRARHPAGLCERGPDDETEPGPVDRASKGWRGPSPHAILTRDRRRGPPPGGRPDGPSRGRPIDLGGGNMIRTRIGALVAATAIAVAACGGATSSSAPTEAPTDGASAAPSTAPSADASAPKPGGTLVVAIPSDLNRTDSALVDDGASIYVLQQIMEPLVQLAQGSGGEIIPDLAESWTISEDGLTYTFKLRSGVKFHDGTDFNAEAVKVNFDRWLNIPTSYVDLGYTYYIDTVIGRGDSAKVVKTEAPDPTTFVLTLNAPNSAFLVTMTLPVFGISSPAALEAGKASDPDFKNNLYAQGGPPAAVGTGPFKFKEWVPGDHVTLVKNEDYWNAAAGGPYLDGVTFKPISESTATLNALQAGDVDIAQILAPNDAPAAESDPKLQYYDRGSACNVGVLAMNQAFKPFDNPKIRQAVAYAINRQAIVDAFFGDTGVVLKNWTPPGTIFSNDLAVPDYDPAKAQALIAESRRDRPQLRLLLPVRRQPAVHAGSEGRVRGDAA